MTFNSSLFQNATEQERFTVDYVLGLVRHSEESKLIDRDRWRENEELFAGKQDWGQDDEGAQWQSRVFMHEYSTIIREMAVQLHQMIFERDEFVSLIAGEASNKELARIREKAIKRYLHEMRFVDKFMEYCMAGGIYGFATWKHTVTLKPTWKPEVIIEKIAKQEQDQLAGVKLDKPTTKFAPALDPEAIEASMTAALNKLLGEPSGGRRKIESQKKLEMSMNLELCNPHLLFWDPNCADLNESIFWAQKSFPKFIELIPFFESGVYDRRKKKYLQKSPGFTSGTGLTSHKNNLRYRQRDQYNKEEGYLPEVELIEYFGPLVKDGVIYEEAAHVVIANSKHLLKSGINPYWDRKPPFLTAVFNKRPFKAEGSGVADNAVNTQKLINELMSLFVDAVKRDVNAPVSANIDKLVDPSEIENGIAPGAVIQTMGDAKASDVFGDFPQASDVAPQLFQTVESLKLTGQKGSSVNTMSSNPASRARISAQEINSNDQRRLMSVNALGAEIDSNCIEALVRRVDGLLLQFGFTNDNLEALSDKGVLTQSERQMLLDMPEIDRFIEARKHYKIQVRGFRATMERSQQLRNAAELVTAINQMPPQVHQSIQWNNVIQDLVEMYGFDPNRWISMNNPQDKAREENQFLMEDQSMAIHPEDDDLAHLPVHYEAVMTAGPTRALVAHIMGHIQQAQSRGQQVPPPPPEVAQALGLPIPGQQMQGQQALPAPGPFSNGTMQ